MVAHSKLRLFSRRERKPYPSPCNIASQNNGFITCYQGTLHLAAGSLALQDKLKVGVISETVAMSLVPYSRTAPTWPKTSQLVAPGPVLFVHYKAFSHDEETT